MKQYITRVELHLATGDDYTKLHSYMAEVKFSRSIPASDGKRYTLPSATYYSYGNITSVDVRELASKAAARTGKSFWILVADTENSAFFLRPIE